MAGTVRARMRRGVLELLEKVDIPEGKEVTITILETSGGHSVEGLRMSAGGWKKLVDADALIEHIYRDRLLSTRPEPRL